MKQCNLKELDRIDPPAQFYHLPESPEQRRFRFLFTWLEQAPDSAIHPDHKVAIWALVNYAHQFWLDAQHQELRSILDALMDYLRQNTNLNHPPQPAQVDEVNCSSELNKLCQKVDEAQEDEDDWDSDGARSTTPTSIQLAKDLLCSAFMEARYKGIHWKMPVVSPGVDGGIHLYWKVSRHRLLIMIRASRQDAVEYTLQGTGSGFSGWLSVDAAVQRVLKALSEG